MGKRSECYSFFKIGGRMKFKYMFIFMCMVSMAYAMEKCNGNGNGYPNIKVAKQDLQSIMDMLAELKEQQVEIQKILEKKAEQDTVVEMEKSQQTMAQLLQELRLNLQPNNDYLMQEPIIERSNGETSDRAENGMLWFSGGFLTGALPFLVCYALFTK